MQHTEGEEGNGPDDEVRADAGHESASFCFDGFLLGEGRQHRHEHLGVRAAGIDVFLFEVEIRLIQRRSDVLDNKSAWHCERPKAGAKGIRVSHWHIRDDPKPLFKSLSSPCQLITFQRAERLRSVKGNRLTGVFRSIWAQAFSFHPATGIFRSIRAQAFPSGRRYFSLYLAAKLAKARVLR